MSNGDTKTAKEKTEETVKDTNSENAKNIESEEIKGLEKEVSAQDEEIIKLNKEIDTLKDLLQRRQADFENFRKRTVKLQEDYKKLAIKDFALDIINVADDLTRAVEASENIPEGEAAASKDSFIEGIKIILKRIEEILNKYGIEEIDSENKPFNPSFHEALEIECSTDHCEDTVTKVYQKGFKLDEHIVRSAKVKVSKPAPKKESDADDKGKS